MVILAQNYIFTVLLDMFDGCMFNQNCITFQNMPVKPHNFEAGDMKTFVRSVADQAGNSLE